MADRVWKFRLTNIDARHRAFIAMPASARPLSVGVQDGGLFVWALCDPEHDVEFGLEPTLHRFIVANTGSEIPAFPDRARFLGTVSNNGIVFHVWAA